MLFSSITFLFYFIPWVFIIYFLTPRAYKNLILLIASLFFYGWGEPKYIILMLFSITVGYVAGVLLEHFRGRKQSGYILTASVFICLALLGFFKYADFFIDSFNVATGLSLKLLRVALPLGISFYTFQIISYIVDVYRGSAALTNYIDLATYIAMFPQLIAGPIVRYQDIAHELKLRTHSLDKVCSGVELFIIGLGKKVIIANTLGTFVTTFAATADRTVMLIWLYGLAYSLQIYFDFSGYSDMAIGLGRMLGFTFPVNFNYPFISRSITEFWRRWHISLGTWFRDYVYIPLGGNKVSRPKWFRNICIVWFATGLWHGAAWNFVLWGIYFAVFLIIEKLFFYKHLNADSFIAKLFSHIYVIIIVIISFVIFDASSLTSLVDTISAMLGLTGIPLCSKLTIYYMKSFFVIIIVGIIAATPIGTNATSALNRFASRNNVTAACFNAARAIILACILIVCVSFLVDGSFNPFLYFRF